MDYHDLSKGKFRNDDLEAIRRLSRFAIRKDLQNAFFLQMTRWHNNKRKATNGQKYNEFHSICIKRDYHSIGAWRGGGYGNLWWRDNFGTWGNFIKCRRGRICSVVDL